MVGRGVRAEPVTTDRRRRVGSLSPARGILVAAAIGLFLWLVVLLVVHAIG
jgi:hypothetical protein